MSRKTIARTAACIILLTAPVLVSGCGEKVEPGSTEVRRKVLTGVRVDTVEPASVKLYLEAAGTVKARTKSSVASKAMGTVTAVLADEGDRVRAGDVLLTIEEKDIAEKIKAAEAARIEASKALEAAGAQSELASLTYERYKKLFEEKAVSAQEFDRVRIQKKTAELEHERVRAMLERAQAGVAEARVYSGYASVKSPVTGLVTSKKIEVGSMASPGMVLMTIEDASSFTVDVYAAEPYLDKLRPGLQVEVASGSDGVKASGKVSEVVSSVDPATRTFLVKIALEGKNLRSGLFVRTRIPVGEKILLRLPAGAVVSKGQLTGVYTVDAKGVVTYTLVRTGARHNDMVEILSGLQPGTSVIVEGASRAFDGAIIKNTGAGN